MHDPIDLASLLSAEELVQLADAFGGTRLYVPQAVNADHRLAVAIGLPAAQKLTAHMAGNLVRVPLLRTERARRHRAAGRSYAWIARRLGVTETCVEKMFRPRVG